MGEESIGKNKARTTVIKNINHINIASDDPQANIHFYCEILGLIHGEDLSKGAGGLYFYAKDNPEPIIHLMDTNTVAAKVDGRSFILNATSAPRNNCDFLTGSLDHVAFSLALEDYAVFKKRLDDAGLPYNEGHDMPPLKQIWVLDPNGIKVELNFS